MWSPIRLYPITISLKLVSLLSIISDAWSFFTSTLMLEAEEIPETLVFNSMLTRLFAQEYFSTFIRRESFKSCKMITHFYKE
jgi:hypothetical protein